MSLRESVSRLLTFLSLGFFALNAAATTVVAPEFDSLVQQAEYVVRGTVKSVVSEWREQNGHRNIVTLVEIDVAETIAGTPPSQLVLQMLGGRVGEKQMIVQGAPVFSTGEEHILFIRGNGVQFTPLVALMHGQYPIKKDSAGRRYIARSDGLPLLNERDVSAPIHAAQKAAGSAAIPPAGRAGAVAENAAAPLTPAEFSARIRVSRQQAAARADEK